MAPTTKTPMPAKNNRLCMHSIMWVAALIIAAPAYAAPRNICGWIDNPTPMNWWISDAKQEWAISTQGSDAAENIEAIPDMSGNQWVPTNGHYGFGCACISADTDAVNKRITRIHSFTQRPLSRCESDKALPHKGRDAACNRWWQASYRTASTGVPFPYSDKEDATLSKQCGAD